MELGKRCVASFHGAVSQSFVSSGWVNITGIAFGYTSLTTPFGSYVKNTNISAVVLPSSALLSPFAARIQSFMVCFINFTLLFK